MFLKGFGIGFGIASIVGPISLLCIRTTLTYGQISGLAIGFGAALADAAYGLIAAFGLTFISNLLLNHQHILRVVGGVFLLYLGLKTFFEKTYLHADTLKPAGIMRTVIGTFFLTMTNPLTILPFLAIFTAIGCDDENTNYAGASLLVFGVFIGAMVWWTILTSFLKLFHARMNQRTLNSINKFSGALIAGFGVLSILSALF